MPCAPTKQTASNKSAWLIPAVYGRFAEAKRSLLRRDDENNQQRRSVLLLVGDGDAFDVPVVGAVPNVVDRLAVDDALGEASRDLEDVKRHPRQLVHQDRLHLVVDRLALRVVLLLLALDQQLVDLGVAVVAVVAAGRRDRVARELELVLIHVR